jgi:CheY-like chemotaxis protein
MTKEHLMDNPARLLMADDEEVFLLSTADLLRQEGYLVDTVMNGHDAFWRLRETQYDLLISDIRMPGNGDLELIQEIPEPNRDLPVILMTGYPSAETAIRAINRSVLAYLVKPMEFQDLLVQVQRGVAQRRVQQAAADSARRIQDWAGEMAQLASGFGVPGGVPVQRMMGAMLGRMGESLLDMKQLLDLSAGLEPDGKTCSVQHCPRLESYQRIFQEGI